MSEAKKRFDELDGLKIFFALGVVLHHYWCHVPMERSLANIPRLSAFVYQYGWLGVEFFFILSGFLMEHTYRNIIADMPFGKFLKRRLKALFPACLCAECLSILICFFDWKFTQGQCWYSGSRPINVYNILLSLTMTSDGWTESRGTYNGSTWFINVLVLCYALYFAVWRLAKRAKIKPLYLYIAAMLFAWGFLQLGARFPFLFYDSCRGYLCFFVGCILHNIQQTGVFSRKFYVFALDLVVLFFLALGHKFGIPEIFGDVRLAFIFLVFPVLILSVENLPPLKKLFAAKPLVWASSYSMDIYLTHMIVFLSFKILNFYFGWNVNLASYKTLGILLLCVFAFAFVWHIVVGKWFVPLFNKWFESFLNVPQSAAPAQSAD